MAKPNKKKTPLLWLLAAFVVILALVFVNHQRSMCVHEFPSPADGVKNLQTVGNFLVAISPTQLYAWDWNSLPGWPKVDTTEVILTVALGSEDGVKILAADNHVLTLHGLKDGKEPKRLYPMMSGSCVDLDASLNGKYAIAAFKESSGAIELSVVESKGESVSQVIRKTLDNGSLLNDIAVSDDGKLIAAAGRKETGWIFVANVESKKILWEKTVSDSTELDNVTFSPDGKLIYASKSDRYVCIFDVAGKLVKELEIDKYKTPPNNPQTISCITISPDSKLLAASTVPASRVWIWDAKTGTKLIVVSPGQFTVNGMVFSPDSSLLATGDLIGKNPMKVWKVPEKP